MYKIKAEGKEYYSDTLVYVKKAPKASDMQEALNIMGVN